MSNYYNRNAKCLFEKYQGLNPDKVHASWLKHLPSKPGLALDVGGGSGRDAAWLAQKGWEVIAIEPAAAMLELGKKATEDHLVTWIDDCLPGLAKLKDYRQKFSLILVSGVLMHLPQQQRADSLETIVNLFAEEFVMVITLRQGQDTGGRDFFQVSADEFVQFAENKFFQVEVSETQADELERAGVTWQTIIVKNRVFK